MDDGIAALAAPRVPQVPQRFGGSQVASSLRPQSHRFVRDAVYRLAEDAQRPATSCTTPSPPQSALAARGSISSTGLSPTPCGSCSCNADAWRRAFHQEAMDCVEAMRSVVSTANISHCGTKLEDWRKVDLKATALLQHHVKELARISQYTEEFLQQCSSASDLAAFRDNLNLLSQRARELAETKDGLAGTIDAIAERASAKVLEAWRREASNLTEMVRNHSEEQRLQWCGSSVQWTRLHKRVDGLEGLFGKLDEALRAQMKQGDELFEASRDAVRRTSELLDGTAGRIEKSTLTATDSLAKEVRGGVRTDLGSLGERLEGLFSEDGRAGRLFGDLADKMQTLQNLAESEASQWQRKAEQLREEVASLQGAHNKATELESRLDSSRSEVVDLGSQVRILKTDLSNASIALDAANKTSTSNGLRRMKELDDRGNLRTDRVTGEVKILTPFEFGPVKPSKDSEPPEQVPTNPEAVALLCADIAELATLIEGPLELEVQTPFIATDKAFSDQLGAARASFLKSKLEFAGVPADRLRVSSAPLKVAKGAKGGTGSVAVMQLDRSLFSAAVVDPKSSGGGKRGASPKR